MAPHSSVRSVLVTAAREFNGGDYFLAHEVLEDGLEAVPDDLWDLFVGLIQIAVGYHKTTQHLRSGAAAMLERGLVKVARFPADAAGLQLEPLRDRVAADVERLRAGTFDLVTFEQQPPRLQLVK